MPDFTPTPEAQAITPLRCQKCSRLRYFDNNGRTPVLPFCATCEGGVLVLLCRPTLPHKPYRVREWCCDRKERRQK